VSTQSDPSIHVTGYRIEARIGRGGMGEVYRAQQLKLGRKVALKVLRPDLAADDGFRRRFLRESMIAAGIDHPNVIPIYDAGEVDGLLYIAMRYVDGFDLATLLRLEGRLDLARTLAVMTQVAGALDAAHARGLVHRDVKPSNILLAPAAGGAGEYCYLCDFGLIKEMHGDSALTATDQFVGSVPYVAPEQVEGGAIDGRTDVYSLGCSIFHCLAGSVPYQGQTDVEVVFAHLRGTPPPLSGRVAGLPPALDGVIARAMARAKEDRYLTCSALVAAAAAQVGPGGRVRVPLVDDETRSMVRPPAPPGPPRRGATVATPRAAAPSAPVTSGAALPPGPPPTVHQAPPRPPSAPRSGGRRWRTLLALLLILAAAYLVAVQLMERLGSPPTSGTQDVSATTGGAAACAWTEPAVGTPDRVAPLDAMRAKLGVSGQFAGVDMRLFTGPAGLKRWYVKAYQQDDRSVRGRWLVDEQVDQPPQVVAEARYDTRGYRRADWRAVGDGVRGPTAALAACLAGT
jgi:serine/threonine protein kinase